MASSSLYANFPSNSNSQTRGQGFPNQPNTPFVKTLQTRDLFIDAKTKPGILEAYKHNQI